MSQQQSRLTQRQIRRALGPEALQMLQEHAAGFRQLASELAVQKQAVANLSERVEQATARAESAQASVLSWREGRPRSLWGRLRWIVQGEN